LPSFAEGQTNQPFSSRFDNRQAPWRSHHDLGQFARSSFIMHLRHVGCHPDLTRWRSKLSLRNDPCATLPLTETVGGFRSDRHGTFESYSIWALRKKMPVREIARRTGLSRNTIKKYLRVGVVEPQFQTPARLSKLDPFAEKLSGWLVMEQRKPRKDRRTAKQVHADLVKLGFDVTYERAAAFVRTWKGEWQQAKQTTDRGTFLPLVPEFVGDRVSRQTRCPLARSGSESPPRCGSGAGCRGSCPATSRTGPAARP